MTSETSGETDAQPLAAELLGTLLLVFFGVGSAVLAGEYIGTLGIALTFAFTLLALVHVLGPVSGSHVNPAVTLAMLLAGRMGPRAAGMYWAAQLAGAIIGAALLFLVAHQVPGLETSDAFGSNGYDDRSAVGLSIGGSFVTEVMLTFLLVFVFLSVTREVTSRGLDGVPIGLALGAVSLIGVPLTGASVNPARSLGPALFAGGDALAQLWLFLLAPLIGAALAALVHRVVLAPPGVSRGPVR
ncbi:MIP/aquaporin family protein [Streptomyces sp. NBC_01803]|uniref:MIP/aquaporin family protein n=1 Tax=Streptomyces sp. NBC_01803 TaxID=2975946 RepID=UPI002DD83E35|nr:aquaporin [Streptomyces sp. NBC_01803]WSA47077.1 aquaporin [Streptomyces sp. NBC_01803]